jgi:hypothetical protein
MRKTIWAAVAAALLFLPSAVLMAASAPAGVPDNLTEPRVAIGPEDLAPGTAFRATAEKLIRRFGLDPRAMPWAEARASCLPEPAICAGTWGENGGITLGLIITPEFSQFCPGLEIPLTDGGFLHIERGIRGNCIIFRGYRLPAGEPPARTAVVFLDRLVPIDRPVVVTLREISILPQREIEVREIDRVQFVSDPVVITREVVSVQIVPRTEIVVVDRVVSVDNPVIIPQKEVIVLPQRQIEITSCDRYIPIPVASSSCYSRPLVGVTPNITSGLEVAIGGKGAEYHYSQAVAFFDVKFGGGKEPAKEPEPPPDDGSCPPGTAPDPPPSGGTPNAPPDDPSGEVPGDAGDQGPEVENPPRIDDQPWAPPPPGTDGTVWLARF